MTDYIAELHSHAEPKLAEFSSKLNPGKGDVIGVRIPTIREIAKRIVKDDWKAFLDIEPECFEEEVLHGLVIATAPMGIEERIALTDGFLHIVDNWATCDIFCVSWKFKKADADRAWTYFSSLIDSDDEFRMRVSVVARFSLFKDAEHSKKLLEDIATHDHPGYYYRMGSAWAVSTIYIRCPEPVVSLLESGLMETWTHNKSIQKICESRRVTDGDRMLVKGLRRREA